MSTEASDKAQHDDAKPRPRKAWATPTIEEADTAVTASGGSVNNVETFSSRPAS